VPSLRLALILSALALPSVARANAVEDTPSQALPTDRAVPRPAVSLVLDAVALAERRIGLEIDVGLGRWQSIAFVPTVVRGTGPGTGLGIELAFRLRPLGRGLDGLLVQASVGVRGPETQTRARALFVGGEVGYTALIHRVALGGSLGIARWLAGAEGRPLRPAVRLLLGYAFG
jgi:hypothetical protein